MKYIDIGLDIIRTFWPIFLALIGIVIFVVNHWIKTEITKPIEDLKNSIANVDKKVDKHKANLDSKIEKLDEETESVWRYKADSTQTTERIKSLEDKLYNLAMKVLEYMKPQGG